MPKGLNKLNFCLSVGRETSEHTYIDVHQLKTTCSKLFQRVFFYSMGCVPSRKHGFMFGKLQFQNKTLLYCFHIAKNHVRTKMV